MRWKDIINERVINVKYIRRGIFVYKISDDGYDRVMNYYPDSKPIFKITYYFIKVLLWILAIPITFIGLVSFYFGLLFDYIDRVCSRYIDKL